MKKSLVIGIILLIFASLALGGYFLLNTIFPMAAPVKLPALESIQTVTVSFDDGDSVFIQESDLQELLQLIQNVSPTRNQSWNDFPDVRPYYTLEFQTETRFFRYFVYTKGYRVYLESPYEGIYYTGDPLLLFLLRYTG